MRSIERDRHMGELAGIKEEKKNEEAEEEYE